MESKMGGEEEDSKGKEGMLEDEKGGEGVKRLRRQEASVMGTGGLGGSG